ncbi:MAG TPA: hypothetical protein VGM87_06165 [Roseomonas sp.]|jgi:hypothetical protein
MANDLPQRPGGDCCLYTVMMGGYERLNEQPVATHSTLPFICLTDDPALRSGSWDCHLVEPVFPRDPVRSQRDLKIRPHLHLPGFARSIYIDNTVILKEPPERLLELADPATGFLLPAHGSRETVLDEFLEVSRVGFDDSVRIFEQLHHYMLHGPEVLQERPWWTAIMVRDHRSARVRAMLEIWALHVMRYSRRDQLSVNTAFRAAGLQPTLLPVPLLDSDLHRWPEAADRDRERGARSLAVSLMPVAARVRQLEQEQMAQTAAIALRDGEAAALNMTLQARDGEVSALGAEVARLAAEGAGLRAETAGLANMLATRDRRIEALQAEAAAATAALAALSAQHQVVVTATTWRVMEPLRRMGRRYRGWHARRGNTSD